MFQRRRFFHRNNLRDEQKTEIAWFDPSGEEMSERQWQTPNTRCLGVHLVGGPIDVNEYGEPIVGDHVLMLFNADCNNDVEFTLPSTDTDEQWTRILDTALATGGLEDQYVTDEIAYNVRACSVVVFCAPVAAKTQLNDTIPEPVAAISR